MGEAGHDAVRGRGPWLACLFAGVLTLVLGLAWAWQPGPWTDEVATLEASRRTLTEMVDLFGYIDLVHALYYFVVHAWSFVFGSGIFAVRALSATAAAVAAVGVVLLAERLGGRETAWWSGLAFALLPVVPLAGAEARSGALVMAAVTWTTVAFVWALDGGRGRWWLYAAGVVVSGLLFLQTVLVVPAHLLTLLWRRSPRKTWLRWGLAAGVAVAALAPFVLAASRQTGQVSWVARPELLRGAASMLVKPWFGESVVVAAACLAWVAVALVVAWRRREWTLVGVAVPWAAIPALLLLLYSHFVTPMYQPRYLAHGAGAVALLMGSGLAAVGRRAWAVAGVLVIAVTSALVVVPSRAPYAKESSDWSQVAVEVANRSRPGDLVAFVPDDGGPRSPRRALDAAPESFAALDDAGRGIDAETRGVLWTAGEPLVSTSLEAGPGERLWVLVAWRKFPAAASASVSLLRSQGFRVETVWAGPTTNLVLAERG